MASALILEEYGLTMKSARENIAVEHRFLRVIVFSQVATYKGVNQVFGYAAIKSFHRRLS
jgi:hypothetical protein